MYFRERRNSRALAHTPDEGRQTKDSDTLLIIRHVVHPCLNRFSRAEIMYKRLAVYLKLDSVVYDHWRRMHVIGSNGNLTTWEVTRHRIKTTIT